MNSGSTLRREISAFFKLSYVWKLLSIQDVKARYKRSVLGPFWYTITTILFVAGLGLVYSRLFKLNLVEYLPYLSVGIIVWTFIITLLNEGANSIIGAGHIIKQISMPLYVHVLRVVFRNFVIFMHSWVVLIPLLIWYKTLTVAGLIFSIFGLLALLYCLTPLVLLLALLCARYRDFLPMVSSALQLLFFITPVMWQPHQLEDLARVIQFNPFYYLIAVVREPMLNDYFPSGAMVYTLCLGSFLWISSFIALSVNYKRIAYWL